MRVLGGIPSRDAARLHGLLEGLERTVGAGRRGLHGAVRETYATAARLPRRERRLAMDAIFTVAAATCDEVTELDDLIRRTSDGEPQGWESVARCLRVAVAGHVPPRAQVLLALRAASLAAEQGKDRHRLGDANKQTAEALAGELKGRLGTQTSETSGGF